MKTARAAMKAKRIMMNCGIRAAGGLAQRGGCALIALKAAGQAGGARAICGDRETTVVGAAIGKVCRQAATCDSKAMTAGTPSSECDGQQMPHPMAHASPASRLPWS